MSKPVLVMMFADNCPHCKKFEQSSLPKFRELLNEYGKVNYVEIHVSDFTKPVMKGDYPKDLLKIRAFPSFSLIPASTWETGKAGGVMNNMITYGLMIKDGNVIPMQAPPNTPENLMSWIKTNMENDKMFNPSFVDPSKETKVNSTEKMIPTYGSCIIRKKVAKR